MAQGRTVAIGDVHGCDTALARLIEAIAPAEQDTIVLLGDLCDRGPDTRRTIDLLIELSRRCNLKVILGNHDEMMLGVFGRYHDGDLTFWWEVGGSETMESYGGDPALVPEEHLDFLESALPCLETERSIFVHAALEPGVPLEEQTVDWLRWRKISGREAPHSSGKRIVCGHTSQRSGYPLAWKGWACIDTRAFDDGGWLTALDVDSDQFIQANESGELRGPFALGDFTH